MHIWSLHPKYLDKRELRQTWDYGLRALTFLSDKKSVYDFSPELSRFRMQSRPKLALAQYLRFLAEEAERRNIHLDTSTFPKAPDASMPKIVIDSAELDYEWKMLIRKQLSRSPNFTRRLLSSVNHDPNPLFYIRQSDQVPAWQRLSN